MNKSDNKNNDIMANNFDEHSTESHSDNKKDKIHNRLNSAGEIELEIKAKDVSYSASAKISGKKEGKITSSNPNINMKLSVPHDLNGEGGEGTNPEQLFALAYGACLFESIKHQALKKQIELPGNLNVESYVELNSSNNKFNVTINLKVKVEGLSEDEAQNLLNDALSAWPYRDIDQASVKINTILKTN